MGDYMQSTRDHTASDGLVHALNFNLVCMMGEKYMKNHRKSPSKPQQVDRFLSEFDTNRLLIALRKVEGFSVPNMSEFALAEVNRFELKYFKS